MLLHFRQRSSNRNSINEGGTILASPPLVSRWINAFISGSWSAAIYFARSNLDGSDREVAQIIARRTLNFIHNYTCFINNYIPASVTDMYVYRPRNISRLENAQGAPRHGYFHTFLPALSIVVSRSRNRTVEAVSKLSLPPHRNRYL